MVLGFDGQRQASVARNSVDQDGAGPALPALAPRLGAGQADDLAQHMQQGATSMTCLAGVS
jgi:hypothetical protein